jgi:hypothetical protein
MRFCPLLFLLLFLLLLLLLLFIYYYYFYFFLIIILGGFGPPFYLFYGQYEIILNEISKNKLYCRFTNAFG